MNERIKKLRKALDLTQQEFANRIGSKRTTIAKYETDTNIPSSAVISLICREFNVSEKWLRTGEGDMFIKPDTFSLDQFVRNHGGTDLEIEIVKAYFELDKDVRLSAVNYFIDRLAAAKARADGKEQETAEEIAPPLGTPQGIAKSEALYESSSGYVPPTGWSASNTTGGTASADSAPPSKASGGE